MFKLGNLGGILYFKDKAVVSFKYQHDVLVSCALLTSNVNELPFELRKMNTDDGSLRQFFEERTTADSRDGIHELLASTPVKYYDPERIIRYNKGRCIHDKYWLECDNDNRCWENG